MGLYESPKNVQNGAEMDVKLRVFGWGSVRGPGCKMGLWDVPIKKFGPAYGGWDVPAKTGGTSHTCVEQWCGNTHLRFLYMVGCPTICGNHPPGRPPLRHMNHHVTIPPKRGHIRVA
jgi:hypothetical protein